MCEEGTHRHRSTPYKAHRHRCQEIRTFLRTVISPRVVRSRSSRIELTRTFLGRRLNRLSQGRQSYTCVVTLLS